MMRAQVRVASIYVVIGSVLVALALSPWVAMAQDPAPAARPGDVQLVDLEELEKDRMSKALRYPVEKRVSRYLAAAAEYVDENNHAEANEILQRILSRHLNPYEEALVLRLLAYLAYGQGDTGSAVEYFERVLALETLPVKDEARIRFNIAQLYASLERWDLVVKWIQDWLRYVQQGRRTVVDAFLLKQCEAEGIAQVDLVNRCTDERGTRSDLTAVADEVRDRDGSMRAGRRAEQLAKRHRGNDGGHHCKASARESRVAPSGASRGTP